MKKLLLKLVFAPEVLVQWTKHHGLHRFFLIRCFVDFLLLPADWIIINSVFKKNNAPGNIHIFHPRTFCEWLLASKLLRRKRRYTTYCDKIAVRAFVASTIGPQYLPTLYWTGTDLRNVDKSALPNKFVIKANHTSGTLFLVPDKKKFDWEAAYLESAKWLAMDYSRQSAEWQYRWISPTLLIEEYLDSENGTAPNDYKFHCMNGHVTCMEYHTNRFLDNRKMSYFSRKFRRLPIARLDFPAENAPLPKPSDFDKMILLAEQLAKGEPYFRVDFYDCGKVRFGEMTMQPTGGNIPFTDKRWDSLLLQAFQNYDLFDQNE